ncbi:MAG: cyclic nucleotide-binding domain-containing protein [Candidatus Binatia bacterium]
MPSSEESSSSIERLLVIKAVPLFAELAAEELAVIAEHARGQVFPAGATLFSGSGTSVAAIHLVLRGSVVERRAGRPFRTHGPQHVVGGIDALALTASDVEAVAEEDTETLSLSRADLAAILEDNFGILWVTLQGVAAAALQTRRRLPATGYPSTAALEPATLAGDTADLAARLAFLRHFAPFSRIKIRTLAQLIHEAEVAALADEQQLWESGESAEKVVVLLQGNVVCRTPDGRRFEAGAGSLLGLEEALALEVRWYSARARGEGLALSISRTAVIDALEDSPESAIEVLSAMASVASEIRDRLARSGPRT